MLLKLCHNELWNKNFRVPVQVNSQVELVYISSKRGKYFYNAHISKSDFGCLYQGWFIFSSKKWERKLMKK